MSSELEQRFHCFFQRYGNDNSGGILLSTFMSAQDTFFRGFDYKEVVKGLNELKERGYIIGNGQSPIEMIYLTPEGRERLFN